jgi:lactoylglutathione lyase
MKFKFVHNNINVKDLDVSLAFYREALGLEETSRIAPEDGSFIIVYLGDGQTSHLLELTWLRDWEKDHYDLGDNEFHLAFRTDDYEAAHAKHAEMGCICFENPAMGIYFITDPDGYWLEVVPARKN